MFVVDTNILIYSAEGSFPEHSRCRELLLNWRQQPGAWFISWGIIYEFLRVVTHPRVFRRPWSVPAAWSFVAALLASPSLDLLVETERHSQVAAEVLGAPIKVAGNLIHDAHTAVLMREYGIHRIITRDADFRRFDFLEVIDPISSEDAKLL